MSGYLYPEPMSRQPGKWTWGDERERVEQTMLTTWFRYCFPQGFPMHEVPVECRQGVFIELNLFFANIERVYDSPDNQFFVMN